jgi:hypothetical protein
MKAFWLPTLARAAVLVRAALRAQRRARTRRGIMTTRIAFAAVLVLNSVPVQAASPWDGDWFVDRASSHAANSTFSLSTSEDGSWKYDAGDDFFVFSPNGNGSAHAGFRADTVITSIRMAERTFDYVESTFGKETSRRHMALSADGKTLLIHDVETRADGAQIPSDSIAARRGNTAGFGGTWEIVADGGEAVASSGPVPRDAPPRAKPAKPTVVIFSDPDGLMSWDIPFSGEVIRGRVDGQRRPITGPLLPSNVTFTWRATSSPNRIEFVGRYGDHIAATAIEELSEDGATLTDTITSSGADKPSVFVLHKS